MDHGGRCHVTFAETGAGTPGAGLGARHRRTTAQAVCRMYASRIPSWPWACYAPATCPFGCLTLRSRAVSHLCRIIMESGPLQGYLGTY